MPNAPMQMVSPPERKRKPRPATPIVAPGAGPMLQEKQVERLISQWLEALTHVEIEAEARLSAFFRSRVGRIGGNPTAQEKWVQRVSRTYGSTLLQAVLLPGKRARVSIVFDRLVTGPAMLSQAQIASVKAGAPVGTNVWLYGLRAAFNQNGPTTELDAHESVVAAFTRHALTRLVQRAGCHTVDDIVTSMKAAWLTFVIAEMMSRDHRRAKDSSVWLLPVRLPSQPEPLVFVMCGPTPEDADDIFFCKTVLSWDMLDGFRRYRAQAFLDMTRDISLSDLATAYSTKKDHLGAVIDGVRNV